MGKKRPSLEEFIDENDDAHVHTDSYVDMRKLLRSTAEAFLAADVNADQVLNYDEFKLIIPEEIRSNVSEATVSRYLTPRPVTLLISFSRPAHTHPVALAHPSGQLRELFQSADANGDGAISREEYVFWVLGWACSGHNSAGFLVAFQSNDTNGDRALNLIEFTHVLENYGFGDDAHHVFAELDVDGNGTVKFSEVLDRIRQQQQNLSADASKLLLAMSLADNLVGDVGGQATAARNTFDRTSPWEVGTVTEFFDALRERLHRASIQPIGLWRACVGMTDANPRAMKLSRAQFAEAMAKGLGFASGGEGENGGNSLLDEVFASIDDDGEGMAAYDEWSSWLRGRPGRRRRVRTMKLTDRPPGATPLSKIEWSTEVLLRELNGLLARNDCSSFDLTMAFDRSDDSTLEKKEFLIVRQAQLPRTASGSLLFLAACLLACLYLRHALHDPSTHRSVSHCISTLFAFPLADDEAAHIR